MPLVRIPVHDAMAAERRRAIAVSVHDAMRATFGNPENDRFMVVSGDLEAAR